jgi:DnaJ domain
VALDSDPYTVLGVSREATDAEIAQARRRLSREYHPDVNRDPDAAARFVEIQRAFELLSDPVARAAYDRARGTEAAPGIFVKPAAVNFGVLRSGRPAVDAEVTVSWTGAPPGRIKSDPGGDWWTTLRAEMPDASRVVFFLRAQAAAGATNGLKFERFEVTLDDTTVAVKLRAEIRGVPSAPTPPTFKTADRVPSVPRPAPRPARPTNWARLGPSLLGLAATLITFILFAANSCGGDGGSVASSPPPVHPINIPQARAAGINVRPVFTPSGPAAAEAVKLDTGLGAPVQRGTEIILPAAGVADTAYISLCVAITVADASSYGAAGDTFLESPVGTATVGKETGAAFPAVLPGTYALDLDCSLISETNSLPLGTVTVPNLGVVNGDGGFDNAMVIFASQTSGAVTTVTYGAIGARSDSLVPSDDDACIDADVRTGPDNYWQPVRVLVGQQITSREEWLSLGTLVFRGTSANSPQGSFFYNCATDTELGPLGILVPSE